MKLSPFAALVFVSVLCPVAQGQTCRVSTVTGGSSTVTHVSGYESLGTSAQTDAADGNYYQITNALGLGPTPVIRTMYSNWVQNAADNSICTNCDPSGAPHPVVYGSSFVNPTNNSITVTQIDVTSNVDHFTPISVSSVTPASGWTLVSRRLVRWTGSVVIASRGAQDFVFADSPQNNASNDTTRSVQLTATATTSGGTFTAGPFTQTALTSSRNQASNASVTFDIAGAAIPTPRVLVPGRVSTAPIDLGIRVGETGNNGTNSGIASGLQLTVTIPPRWSNVSVPTILAPWSAATLSITQPTATSSGQITISTNAIIAAGTNTAANTLVMRATAPRSSVTNLFPFRLSLSGVSRASRTINSFNDAVVQVLGNGTEAINSEFFSSTIGPGPVHRIDFVSDFNVTDGVGGEAVTVQVFNNNTSAWDPISTVTPGASNATLSRTFTTDYLPYVNSNRMKIRFLSNGTTVRTLRLDRIGWSMTLGYTVDNASGNDANAGDVARPFRSLARAATALGASGAAYVEIGTSPSGAAYDSNIVISGVEKNGTSVCKTAFLGVASSGQLPRVRGVTPINPGGSVGDFGFDLAANHIQVDGFQIENTGAAFAVEPGVSGAVISNNDIRLVNLGYGVAINPSTGTEVTGNKIDATGTSGLFGVVDSHAPSASPSQATLIDNNKVLGFTSGFGIYTDGNAPVIRRNVVANQFFGIYLADTTGTATLYNNTIDQSALSAVEVQGSSIVVSRNNIFANSGYGIRADTPGSVNSDYDDAYANTNNYSNVTAGIHSITADPLFIQTTNSTLPTFYRLNGGSPCINAGTDVGLTFLGTAPDIGAVETQ